MLRISIIWLSIFLIWISVVNAWIFDDIIDSNNNVQICDDKWECGINEWINLNKNSIKDIQSELWAAQFLGSKWIIKNQEDSNDFRLSDTITRKEVMKIVMKLSGKTIPDTCNWVFSDVPADWGCKYIETALTAWYIAANDTFRPDDNITKTEAMKLVLKAKWIQKIRETVSWQSDYMETAYFYGIIDSKYTDFNAHAHRGWIFSIATATIQKQDEIFEKGWIISDEAL